jgi:DNA-binding NarL/FixJ family response regulator
LVERLTHDADIQVIGDTGDAAQVLPQIESLHPDVVLVEVKRSDGMGLEILRQIHALAGGPRVVVLTSYESDWEVEAARRAGAAGYLLKDLDSDELLRSIREMSTG